MSSLTIPYFKYKAIFVNNLDYEPAAQKSQFPKFKQINK